MARKKNCATARKKMLLKNRKLPVQEPSEVPYGQLKEMKPALNRDYFLHLLKGFLIWFFATLYEVMDSDLA